MRPPHSFDPEITQFSPPSAGIAGTRFGVWSSQFGSRDGGFGSQMGLVSRPGLAALAPFGSCQWGHSGERERGQLRAFCALCGMRSTVYSILGGIGGLGVYSVLYLSSDVLPAKLRQLIAFIQKYFFIDLI